MAQIVTEDFTQRLFADPMSKRQNKPTIFDELRWALQHSQRPLEQVIQLISEFHGPYTGMTSILQELIAAINCNSSMSVDNTKSLQLLNELNSSLQSSVGRQNNITCSDMSIPLLREFIARCHTLHPTVNNYIQLNIGKFPFFQQISDDIGLFGKIVLQKTDVPAIDRTLSNGLECLMTNFRLRRNSAAIVPPSIFRMIDEQANLLDVLFFRGMNKDNNMSLLNTSYGKETKAIAHGHNYTMDAFNGKRNKDVIKPCLNNAVNKFGALLELDNILFPIKYEITNKPRWFNTENGIVDGFNRPLTREVTIPTASEQKKTALS